MRFDISDVALQQAECRVLKNGVKLYTLPSDDFEVLRVSFVFGAGPVVQNKAFTASATAYLLGEGSTNMSAHEIAEKLDFYGSSYEVNIDRESSYFTFCTLSKFTRETLEVAHEILLHPAFEEHEISLYCANRKQRLRIEREKVETKAREELARSLFGVDHPYGVSYSEEEYDRVERGDLIDIYQRFYVAGNCFVVCSGRVDDAQIAQISALAELIPHRESPKVEIPQISKQRPYLFVPQAGAVQSSIRIGRLLFARTHPDFLGMQILATTLGGYFGSRLMQRLREERGYTYGVMSAMINLSQSGYFAIATQVGVEVTHDAIAIIKEEVERLGREPIPHDELEMVRSIMVGEIMRILNGPFGIADVTIENILCGVDNSIIERNVERIFAYTPEELQRLAQRHLSSEDMLYVIVGGEDLAI